MKDFVKCGNVALLMILVLNLMFPRGAFADGRSSGQNGPGLSMESDPAIEEFLLTLELISEKLLGPDHPVQGGYVFDEAIMSEGVYSSETVVGEPLFIEVFYVESLMPSVPILPFGINPTDGMVSEIHARFWSAGNYVDVLGICMTQRINDVNFPSGVASLIVPMMDFEDIQVMAQRIGMSLPPFEHFDPDCPDEFLPQTANSSALSSDEAPCAAMQCRVGHICPNVTVQYVPECDPEVVKKREDIKSQITLFNLSLAAPGISFGLGLYGLTLCVLCLVDPTKLSCISCLAKFFGAWLVTSASAAAFLLGIERLRNQLADFEAAELNKACATGRYRDNPNLMEFPEGL